MHTSTAFITVQNSELALKLNFEYENQIKFYSSYVSNDLNFTPLTMLDGFKSEKILSWLQTSMDAINSNTVEQINFKGNSLL